ncbi:FkbM family methyltransferase [Alphaproteobacteria bacterium]|nr:FkbM family methyltransferase [Alphaproteobacteria bacterium]
MYEPTKLLFVFEPNNFLVDNYLNKLKRKDKDIEIYNYGIGNNNSTQYFYIPFYKNKCLHMFSSFKENIVIESLSITYPHLKDKFIIKKYEFEVKKLDDINLFTNLHFVKIDAEGFEFKIIEGMDKLIKRFKPYLLIEYNESNFEKICKKLQNYNPYRYDISNNTLQKLPKYIDNNKDISRIDSKNLLASRNIYFIPTNDKINLEITN